jgi:uncharacterized membrane protein
MTGLAWSMVRSAGWGRAALLAACTAVVSGLLLVVSAVLSLPDNPEEQLFGVVRDVGTRGGFAFGTVMLGLPALLLLFQAVRLGTSARERRLAALRLAGATPGDVRRIGALEVGAPAFVGAVGGLGVYWLLRTLLSDMTYTEKNMGPNGETAQVSLRLVPTSVSPTWWQFLLVVVGVTLLGVLTGLLAGRGVMVTPLGVARRTTIRPPRPWGLLVMAAGVAVGLMEIGFYNSMPGAIEVLVPLLALALLIFGMISLAPWTAYVVGKRVAARATSGPVLLAARRLATDPRPAGRAAAAVGAIGLVAGGSAAMLSDLLSGSNYDRFYFIGVALVVAALLVALVAVVGSLSVHSVESLLDRKRSVAALVALGSSTDVLIRSQRWEVGLVAMPMSVIGTLLGAVGLGLPLGDAVSLWWVICTVTALVATTGLLWLSILVAVRLTRPWTLSAADPANLRTA